MLLSVSLGLALPPAMATDVLRLATTTSVQTSGLLEVLLPAFEVASDYQVSYVAVGSGVALRMARAGDVDAVLSHSPAAEHKLVADGHALARHPVFRNSFVIVGPAGDPAGIRGLTDSRLALQRIRQHGALFVSRGDDSGTHRKELTLWRAADIDPIGERWYREMGVGISAILRNASDQQAYTLTDKGSWLQLRGKLQLQLLLEGDPRLQNPYAVIAVNPARHPQVNGTAAQAFVSWIRSPAAQKLIDDFRVDGEHLFAPALPTN
jgi:tungstate transport system substrate-binding protein